MFKTTHVNLGYINPKSKHTIRFPYESDMNFLGGEADCGCTDVTNDRTTNEVILKYSAGEIPYHLAAKGYTQVQVNKSAIVKYVVNGIEQSQTLSFSGIIKS